MDKKEEKKPIEGDWMVKKVVKCVCGTNNTVNTDKHNYREKRCRNCLRIIDNESPKHRVLSAFQMKKKETKKRSRERFINRMLTRKMPMKEIEKRLDKQFDFEKDDIEWKYNPKIVMKD